MSNLALAGAVSGMGQGLERGLSQLQAGIQQSGLQVEQRQYDATQRAADRTFQSEKLREQLAHAEKLQAGNQDFQSEQNEKNRALEADRNAIAAGKAEDDRAHGDKVLDLQRDKLEADTAAENKKLGIMEQSEKAKSGYYEAYKQYLLGGKGGKGGTASAKIDLDTRKAGAAFYSQRIAPLEKQAMDPLTTKEERDVLNQKIERLSKEGLAILGFDLKGASPDEPEIDDPFSGTVAPKPSEKAGEEKPAAPPERPKVRGERVVPNAPPAPVGPLDALRGGAAAPGGLLDSVTPFSPKAAPEITIEKRKGR